MSRTRPVEGPTISLFPFLAVLLCTMGSLLVLLVLFSRSAREEAETSASGDVTDLELARDSLRWRVEQLAGVRERTASDLEAARLQLAGVEDHTRALTDELEKLEALLGRLETDGPRSDPSDLATLEAKLASARESLDEAKAEARTKPPAYAVVPYVGRNGTHRRPLYIECCIDGVFLQPEGVRLSPGDFEGPPGPGNPLACALRAAREHIARSPNSSTDPASQPYPLLLVRPSGVMAYYAAREAIQSWGSDFGYQLVEEDWTLTYPPRDPALAEVEKRAIDEARQRLAWLAEVRPARAPRQPQQYRAATTRGGVVAEGGPSVLGDQSRFEWKNQQATHGASGDSLGGGGGSGSRFGAGTGAGGASAASGNATGAVGPGRPLAAGGSAGDGGGENRGVGGDDHGAGDVVLGSRTGEAGAGGGAGAPAVGGVRGSAASRGEGDVGPAQARATDARGEGQVTSTRGGAGADGRYAKGSRFGGGGGDDGGDDSGASGGGGGSVSVSLPGVAGTQSGGGMAGSGSAIGAQAAGQPAAGAGGEAMPGLMQQAGGGSGQPSAGGASAASASMSLAQARGRNWASLATQDRPIPLTRPIQIECALDEFRLLDDHGRRVRSRIPVAGETAAAIDPLVKAIHSRVTEWGLAGDRMYWKPQLILSATADGRSRRDDLERLLADSGLDTRHSGHEDEIRNLPPVQRTSYLHEEH